VELDINGMIQLMEMMNAAQPGSTSPDHRNQRLMLTILKLMETKKLMESCEAHSVGERGNRNLHMLMALRPHMTGERLHTTDILIKLFEIRQIMDEMGAGAYEH